jgi:hypothetical protein
MGGLSAWRQQLLAELLVCLFPLRATSHQPHRGSDPASHTAAQIHTQHTQIPDPHCHMGAHGLLAPGTSALGTPHNLHSRHAAITSEQLSARGVKIR